MKLTLCALRESGHPAVQTDLIMHPGGIRAVRIEQAQCSRIACDCVGVRVDGMRCITAPLAVLQRLDTVARRPPVVGQQIRCSARFAGAVEKLTHQPGFADARLAADKHDAPVRVGEVAPTLDEECQFALTADKLRT